MFNHIPPFRVLAVAGCHVVADFRTLASFLEHWAAAYRSLEADTNASAGVTMVSINALAVSSMARGRQATGTPATATTSTATAALPAAAASCAVDLGSLAADTSGHISESRPLLPGGSPVWVNQQVDALAADKAPQEVTQLPIGRRHIVLHVARPLHALLVLCICFGCQSSLMCHAMA